MKNYKIAVAGTGYVGLSLGVLLSQHHQVVTVDIVQAKVDMINNKKSPIQDDYIEKYLAEKDLNLTATLDAKAALTNCVVLENGIDMERLQPAITSNQEHPHTFVSLGRLGERKGTYDLITAIEQAKTEVPDIKCYLAGDGEIEKCKDLIKQKKLDNNIIVVGWADFDKKLELLRKSSVLVLPSYNEGLPMAILEGMACGKAIISTTVGAIPEVVKEENGILIHPGDTIALADALRKYCRDEKAVEMAGSANRNLIKRNYSMDVMHQKLARYYIGVMQE